jgi:hypothetical protein
MSISRRIVTAGVAGVLAAGLVGAGLAWAGSAGGGGGGTVVPAATSDPAPASGYMSASDDFGGAQGFDRSIAQDDGTQGHHCDHDGSGGSGSGGSGSSSQGSSGAQSDSGASTSASTQPTTLGT